MLSKSTSLLAPYGPAQKWVKPRIKCVQLNSTENDGIDNPGKIYFTLTPGGDDCADYYVYYPGVIDWNEKYNKIVVGHSFLNNVEKDPDSNVVITDLRYYSDTSSTEWVVQGNHFYLTNYFTVIAMLEGTDLSVPYPSIDPTLKRFPITRYTISNGLEDIIQQNSLQDNYIKVTRKQSFPRKTSPSGYYSYHETYTIAAYCDAFPDPIIGKIYTNTEFMCFTKHTRILLGDHTWKTADQLTVDDIVVCWDFDRGEMTSSPLLWLMKRQLTNQYHKIITNTGRVFENVGNHRLFGLTTNRFERALELLNHDVWTIDGVETIVSIEQCNQSIDYYNAISANHMNLITDGFLSSCGFNNLYPINDMKYIKQPRPKRPIEMYGDIPQSWYTCLRLDEHYCDPTGVKRYIDRCIENAC